MTTLVAINTRDAVVIGSDTLGTVTRSLVDLRDLSEYFESGNGSKLKVGSDGRPLLDELAKIISRSHEIPYSYMTHVDKLFSLSPLEMGVMAAGIAAIGDRTIKNLIAEFKMKDKVFKSKTSNYTLKTIGERLLGFLWGYYSAQHPDASSRPDLELMLCGYDKQRFTPGVLRIYVHENRIGEPDYDFCLFLGGQTKEIQRLVFGTDVYNKTRLMAQADNLLKKYHSLLSQQLQASGVDIKLKEPEEFGEELKVFHNWNFEGMSANWSSFSEQNAIECIDFLVKVMINSQHFSTQIPSVGGEVQIAVVKKGSGFNLVSKRVWRHGDYAVPACE